MAEKFIRAGVYGLLQKGKQMYPMVSKEKRGKIELQDGEKSIMGKDNNEGVFVLCPVCRAKTRTQIRKDTVLKNFPLFCPKCKGNFLIEARNLEVTPLHNQGMD